MLNQALSRKVLGSLLLLETFYITLLLWKLMLMNELCQDHQLGVALDAAQMGPKLYIITPTYTRSTQIADLTRLSQTLKLVHNIHWIVVEDSEFKTQAVSALLQRCNISYTHLTAVMPEEYKEQTYIGRGVFNRRAGLDWLRANAKEGVLYFADDDNTYDVRILEEIRWTKTASVFPVGMVQAYGISSPIVRNNAVIGFHDAFQGGRKFAVDMAGFAVNLWVVLSYPDATIPTRVSYLEDGFLRRLHLELQDLEPMANGCTEVLVWHTRTQRPATPNFKHIAGVEADTNLALLYHNINAVSS